MITKFRIYESKRFHNLDRFAIWHMPADKFYEILKITGVEHKPDTAGDYEYTSDILYFYYPDSDTFKKVKKDSLTSGVFYEVELSTFIHYTSDSLEDCKEMVKIISNEIKYNL